MHPLFETVTDLACGAEVLRRRTYGVIEARDGQFHRVLLRPYPKLVSLPEIRLLGLRRHARRRGDRVLLYYDQPWRFRDFLAVKYAVSDKGTSYQSIRRVLEVLDEIARLKGTDALLCDASNRRLTTKMLARAGWEPHCPASRRRRHFIKRFYGEYPWQTSDPARTRSIPLDPIAAPGCLGEECSRRA